MLIISQAIQSEAINVIIANAMNQVSHLFIKLARTINTFYWFHLALKSDEKWSL